MCPFNAYSICQVVNNEVSTRPTERIKNKNYKERQTVVKIIALLILLLWPCACINVSTSPTPPSTAKTAQKPPATSPAEAVNYYLEALKKRDFGKTYDFISGGYAANLDRGSYEVNMKQSLDKSHWTLLSYEVLGVQILGDQAFVLTELEVRFKPANSEKETQKKVRIQYGLTVSEKKWKISVSNCILNCVSAEDFAG
jgi:hypothetical protein